MPDPETPEPEVRMSFGDHLDELRRRILRALYGAVIAVGFCIWQMYAIFELIIRPYRLAVEAQGGTALFNPLKPQEVFMTYISLAIQAGLVLSSPWIIYQLWQFVAAGLYERERKIVYRYVAPSSMLFLLGVAFFYFIVLPLTLSFFLGFASHTAGPAPKPNWLERQLLHMMGTPPPQQVPATATATASSATAPETGMAPAATQTGPMRIPVLAEKPAPPPEGTAFLYFDEGDRRIKLLVGKQTHVMMATAEDTLFLNQWRAEDYLTFVAFSSLVFGVAFEMPMVILILAQTGIVQAKTFRDIRKYAYFGILVAAVAVAPSGDLMTLMFLFVPLIALYELGIVVATIVVARAEAREKAAADS